MSQQEKHFYEFGEFRMDIARRRLWRNGEIVPLAPKVFDLLVVLIEQSGKTLEKDELMQRVWPDTTVEENNLTQNIYTLRKILDEKRGDSRYIATVSGIGYRFVAAVRRIPLADEGIEIHEKTEAHVIVTETIIENDARELPEHHDLSSVRATPLLPAAIPPRFGNNKMVGGLLALVIVLAVVLTYIVIQNWRVNPSTESLHELTVTPLTRTGTAMRAAISPDGRHIEYVVKEGDRQSILLRQLATGSTQQIVPPEEVIYYTLIFSRDGNYLYFVKRTVGDKENVLYKMPWLGGIPTKLAAGMDSFIAISPDDRRLAFVRNSASESALIIINVDGSEERRLAVRPITDYFKVPAWSPDGRIIACSTGSGEAYNNQNSLVEISLSDGQQKPLTTKKWHWTRWVEWLPDGSGLLLTAEDTNAQPSQIWHLSYPSGQVRQMTNDSQTYFGLSLTADAKTLAATQTQLLSEIWLTTLGADHAAKKLNFGTGFYSDVCFASDGRIIYSSKESGNDDIWRMNADGAEKQQLTTDSNTDLHQAVSPDGRYLVFASNRSGAFNLWRIQSDGSNPVRLTSGPGEKFPHFSPDGQWVIYNDVASDESYYSLWKIPITGGQAVRIAERTDKAAVSPNGKHIAYFASESPETPHHKIMVIPFAGGPPEHSFDVPPDLFPIREVHWAKDSRALFYSAEQHGFSDIWQQSFDGGPPKRVTNLKMEGRLLFDLSPDGKQLVLTRRLWTYDVLLLGLRR